KCTIEETATKKIAEVFDPNRITVPNQKKIENKPRAIRTKKKLTAAQEIEINGWVDENLHDFVKTISKICMQEFCVMICKSTMLCRSLVETSARLSVLAIGSINISIFCDISRSEIILYE
ncbi:hypothetical protein HZS_3273, partial [Henneguya salminicola]